MSIKLRAAINTLIFVGTIFIGSLSMSYLLHTIQPTTTQVLQTIGALLGVWFVYIVYAFNKSNLEYREKLAEIANKE